MRIIKLSGITARAVVIAVFTAMMAGCAGTTSAPKTAEVQKTKLINSIEIVQTSDATTVSVQGDQTLTYTSVKQPLPLGIILYFPDTRMANVEAPAPPESTLISKVEAEEITENGQAVKLAVLLKQDAPYEVLRKGTGLEILIKETATSLPSTEASAPKQTTGAALASESLKGNVYAVEANPKDDAVEIKVKADRPLSRYDSFTVESPPRIVYDIYDVKSADKAGEMISVDSRWVKSVRHFAYPDRLRLLIDTEIASLNEYSAKPVNDGLVISVGGSAEEIAAKSAQSSVQASTPSSGKMAWMNRIDFASEAEGKSTIIIGTTQPVEYEMRKAGPKRLELKLLNTGVQDFRQRPLITTRFESAVDRIIPVQKPSMKNYSIISIELREAAPYFVEQQDDLLFVRFDPSSIPPKPMDLASLAPWEQVVAETGTKVEAEEAVQGAEEASFDKGVYRSKTPKYSGEKIALDFYETDIKNVFRILREVSGKNFAIDKDVTGKVTLTLEHPVPWDQVLDLVLRMNQLGLVYEGDIVRIATLSTLQKEQELREAKFEAEKKAKEQEVAVEPLITEYIPINYSNAKSDIQPHLEKILTEGRGSISVDERTNMVIMTDVAAKIIQAREIVTKLDRVTPQVIIEARIVEASTTFAREIGTSWGAQGGIQNDTDTVGYDFMNGISGYNMGINFPGNIPSTSYGSIGFNFRRIAGTPFFINAAIAAMESRGEAKLISSPKIVTLDNKEASIKQGVEYPYLERDESGLATLEWKDISLELKVTPHVTLDNRISMKIFIEKNDLGNIINNQQSFTTKGAETELLVDDGDTIVIGGIIKMIQNKGRSGLPVLMDIPILGWLFKTQNKTDNKEELLIFITPRIVQLEQRMVSSEALAK